MEIKLPFDDASVRAAREWAESVMALAELRRNKDNPMKARRPYLIETMAECYLAAKQEAKASERAVVVAWLREFNYASSREIADAIERGEHDPATYHHEMAMTELDEIMR